MADSDIIFLMGNPAGDAGSERNVLFLDDMEWRHSEFSRCVDDLPGFRIWRVHTAEAAVELLMSRGFVQVFLDHDLSDDDVMCVPGSATRVPTGMDVVDHILGMEHPPSQVVIHSCNGPAALEMERRLETHSARIAIRRIPFPFLMQSLRSTRP